MNFTRTFSVFICILGLFGLLACKTSQPITSGSAEEKEISLYSSGDVNATIRPDTSIVNDSIKNIEKSLAANPRNVEAMVSLAELYYVKGDSEKAELLAKKALTIQQKSPKARFVLAKTAYSRGKFPLAEMILEGINGSDIPESQLYNLKGLIALGKSNHSLAFHLFKLGLEKDPQDISIRMNLGVLYLKYKQLASASIEFERILKIVPNHSDAKLHLSIAKLGLGDVDRAAVLASEVVDAHKDNPIALFQMAYVDYKKGRYEESSEWLKKYVGSVHQDAEKLTFAYQLGEKLRMSGSKSKGISNEEINALATRLNSQQQNNAPKSAQMNAGTNSKKSSVDQKKSEALPSEPVAKSPEPKQKIQVGDEIEELENILSH